MGLNLFRYEESKAKGTDNYDRDLEDVIDRLILECDRKITRALRRLEAEDAKAAIAISVSEVTQVMVDSFNSYVMNFHSANLKFINWVLLKLQTSEVLELSKHIKEKLKEADQYGNVYRISV